MTRGKNCQRSRLVGLCWVVILMMSCVSQAWAATVDGVRLWRAPDHTRIVLDMSGDVNHKLFQLDNPARLVVDIQQASRASSTRFDQLTLKNTPIKRIRTAVREQKNLRLVFDLSATVKPRSFFLGPNKTKPHRLVIDLYDQSAKTEKTVAQATETTSADHREPSKVSDDNNQAASHSAKRDIVIVVDAGHGGEDPGAVGYQNLYEKVVVLDVAKRLAKMLNATKGYKAVLTRTGDYFIPLRKRRDAARKHRADLFISVHADAFTNLKANGASVYALSRRGATSETARFLAQKENEADLIGGVGDVSLEDKDKVLRGVLVDLSMTATVGTSLDVGKYVLEGMGKVARLHKKQVEQAGFLVLKSPDVPSILVETGFISNPTESKRLATPSYRQKIAQSIYQGTKNYFSDKPPEGTYIAWKRSGGKESESTVVAKSSTKTASQHTASTSNKDIVHKVVNGDSLSMIAQRYRVSMAKIKKLNNLKSNSIRIGQKLVIARKKVTASAAATHKVKSGETLSEIALRYKTSVNAIRRLNNMSALSIIRSGQTLKIPRGKS